MKHSRIPYSSILVMIVVAGVGISRAGASSLYFNPAVETGAEWSDANQWSSADFGGPFDAHWSDQSVAHFRPEKNFAVDLAGIALEFGKQGGIVNEAPNANTNLTIRSSSPAEVHFDGGIIKAGGDNTKSVGFSGKISITGKFTLVSGALGLSTVEADPFSGTATITGGLVMLSPDSVGSESNFVTMENAVAIHSNFAGEYQFGSVRLDAGIFYIGVTDDSGIVRTTLSALESEGLNGGIQVRRNTIASGMINALTVRQDKDTTYSGRLVGDNISEEDPDGINASYLLFTKEGRGNLTLKGQTVRLLQGTVISGGGLYIDDPEVPALREFDNRAGGDQSAAITVAAGGTLGGNSKLKVAGERSVVVEKGGALAPGSVGSGGVLKFEFESGRLDLAAAAEGTGWIKMDIGGSEASDQIKLIRGVLRIGNGKLDFDDFSFNCLPEFGPGEYVLFACSQETVLDGELGKKLSGAIAKGFTGRLSVEEGNVVLQVTRSR